MITTWTNWFLKILLEEQKIQKEELELYQYCVQTMLFQGFVYGLIILLAVSMDCFAVTLFYYLGFLPLRYTAGGFHARTHKGCLLLSIGIYWSSMVLLSCLPTQLNKFLATGMGISILLIIWKSAPIDHANRPFQKGELVYFRRKSLQAMLFVITCSLFISLLSVQLALVILLGTFCAAISLLFGKEQRRRELC